MATIPQSPNTARVVDYPTSDGRPMAETDVHRDEMVDLIQALKRHYADDPMVYVSGNILVFYVEGDKHKHVSPDVLITLGIAKRRRDNYLIWEEDHAPDFVIELTSKSTRKEDTDKKFALYRDILKVREYFLFDPFAEYLKPPFQGHRLVEGRYEPIAPVAGRLPSMVTGLHLERDGLELRLFNPATGSRLPTSEELILRETEARRHAEGTALREAEGRRHAEEELARLRRELEALKGGPG